MEAQIIFVAEDNVLIFYPVQVLGVLCPNSEVKPGQSVHVKQQQIGGLGDGGLIILDCTLRKYPRGV